MQKPISRKKYGILEKFIPQFLTLEIKLRVNEFKKPKLIDYL